MVCLRVKIKYIGKIDADLQHDPKYITNLIKIWENEQVDMVIGFRGSFKENITIKILKTFYYKISMLPKNLERYSDFRLLDSEIKKSNTYLKPIEKNTEVNYKGPQNIDYRGPQNVNYTGYNFNLKTNTEWVNKYSHSVFVFKLKL